jgi:hypothetical protein
MFSQASTLCSLPPTNGQQDNQQMVDKPPPFTDRLDAALAMHDMSNPTFAALVNPNSGQQLVNRWRARGRVGRDSEKRVAALLPKVNMEWLQDGVGDREKFTPTPAESSRSFDAPPSYATRLPPSILAKAVRVMEADEALHGKNPPLKHAILLLQYCDRIAGGEEVADLVAEISNEG